MTLQNEGTPSRLDNYSAEPAENRVTGSPISTTQKHSGLQRVFYNEETLRSGWRIAIFVALLVIILFALSAVAEVLLHLLHRHPGKGTALTTIIGEAIPVLSTLGAARIMARIERRRAIDYNLSGPKRAAHLLIGIGSGFVALNVLIACLHLGGWIQFGSPALSGLAVLQFGALWGVAFLLTGLFEESGFRGYLQFTLTGGINFWWAIGVIAIAVLATALNPHSSGPGGVYAAALTGLGPTLILHLRRHPDRGFWLAAWVTSTVFGYTHTFNDGEAGFGIFCTAAIGFVFCASIRLTGSLWWAIGYHASWDWGQTFFFGTPDSGFVAQGHYLTTYPAGKTLWSGGVDGPEGSLLVLPVIVLTLLLLVIAYRSKPKASLNPLP